ncbi:STAS domain-containing protein [Streptomyces sp. ALB3]|uniref:STAS domain-containing protein n=1 Tax=Streptomyces sp. ALB3 TaxID=3374278 RepID=UPI0037A2E11F
MTVYPFTSHVAVRSSVGRVALAGELDLDTAPDVQEAVAACLAKQPTRLHLDLTDVTFCDCAGLSSLLMARSTVLRAGVGLVVEGVGAQLARLLSLIGADDVLTGRDAPADPELDPPVPDTATVRGGAEAAA